MKTCKIFWIGQTSNGVPTIGVKWFESGFACKRFVEVESTDDFEVDQDVDVPAGALS